MNTLYQFEQIHLLKNDIWLHILKTHNYQPNNKKNFTITSNMIKECKKTWHGKSQFEPRLLCKQDTIEKLPKIFKLLGINIISVKNGEYLITKSNIYHKLDYTMNFKEINCKINNKSLLINYGNSETTLLDTLRYNGIFEHSEFLDESILYGPLLGGRHRCKFKMKLDGLEIDVCGSQFETDGCYESENKILLTRKI